MPGNRPRRDAWERDTTHTRRPATILATTADAPSTVRPWRVGIRAAALLGAALATALASGVVQPVDLLLPGREGPAAALIRRDFPGTAFRNEVGFDGQQYYALARFFPHLDRAAPWLDDPQIRSQRILQPALGRLGGRGAGVVYVFVALGVLGVGLAVGGLAALAAAAGRSPSLGYAAAVPLVVPVLLSTPEPLAYGCALAGCALAARGRVAPAAAMLGAGALARESAALVAVAATVGLWRRGHRCGALVCVAAPLALLATWQAVVRRALADVTRPYARQVQPLGLLHADPVNLALALGAITVFAWAAWRWRSAPPVAALAAVFAASVLALAPRNLGPLALTRTMAPAEALALAALADAALRWRPRGARPPHQSPG